MDCDPGVPHYASPVLANANDKLSAAFATRAEAVDEQASFEAANKPSLVECVDKLHGSSLMRLVLLVTDMGLRGQQANERR
jgi:hypothetical protein